MNHPTNDHNPEQAIDFAETVCAPEFPEGCIDPAEPVTPAESAPAEPPLPSSADDDERLCFTEDVCSAEFIEGCVNPAKKKK